MLVVFRNRHVVVYTELENILVNGRSKIYGNRSSSMRHPKGVQAVMRKTDDEMMIVYHSFADDLQPIEFEIPEGFAVKAAFYGDAICVSGTKVHIEAPGPFTAGAVYLTT